MIRRAPILFVIACWPLAVLAASGPTITSLGGDGETMTLSVGSSEGVEEGMTGRLCRSEWVGPREVVVCLASFEVIDVDASSATAAIVKSRDAVTEDLLVRFDQELVPPAPPEPEPEPESEDPPPLPEDSPPSSDTAVEREASGAGQSEKPMGADYEKLFQLARGDRGAETDSEEEQTEVEPPEESGQSVEGPGIEEEETPEAQNELETWLERRRQVQAARERGEDNEALETWRETLEQTQAAREREREATEREAERLRLERGREIQQAIEAREAELERQRREEARRRELERERAREERFDRYRERFTDELEEDDPDAAEVRLETMRKEFPEEDLASLQNRLERTRWELEQEERERQRGRRRRERETKLPFAIRHRSIPRPAPGCFNFDSRVVFEPREEGTYVVLATLEEEGEQRVVWGAAVGVDADEVGVAQELAILHDYWLSPSKSRLDSVGGTMRSLADDWRELLEGRLVSFYVLTEEEYVTLGAPLEEEPLLLDPAGRSVLDLAPTRRFGLQPAPGDPCPARGVEGAG